MNLGDYKPSHCALLAQTLYLPIAEWSYLLNDCSPETLARLSAALLDWTHEPDTELISPLFIERLHAMQDTVTGLLISKLSTDPELF